MGSYVSTRIKAADALRDNPGWGIGAELTSPKWDCRQRICDIDRTDIGGTVYLQLRYVGRGSGDRWVKSLPGCVTVYEPQGEGAAA